MVYKLKLPKEIGAKLKIRPPSEAQRKEIYARGFIPAMVMSTYWVIRRDFADGVLKIE